MEEKEACDEEEETANVEEKEACDEEEETANVEEKEACDDEEETANVEEKEACDEDEETANVEKEACSEQEETTKVGKRETCDTEEETTTGEKEGVFNVEETASMEKGDNFYMRKETAHTEDGEMSGVDKKGISSFTMQEKESSDDGDLKDSDINCLMPSELMYVSVDYRGSKMQALIDSGCSTSVIQHSSVKDLIQPLDRCRVLRGLDQIQVEPLGQVQIKFSILDRQFESKFIVVPDSTIRTPIILGNNFFFENDAELDIGMNRMSGGSDGGLWDLYLIQDDQRFIYREIPVLLDQELKLRPGETALVDARINTARLRGTQNLEDMYYEAVVGTKDIAGVSGRLDVVEGRTKVLLSRGFTTKGDFRVLQKGCKIGTLATFVDVMAVEDVDPSKSDLDDIDLSYMEGTQADEVRALLREHRDIISTGEMDIGCAGVTRHRIELYDQTPIRQHPRRFPGPVVDEIERQCKDLLEQDIIEFSKSPWSSPVVPVRKKDGSLRVCIDYRKLNSVTKPDRHPMPNMTDLVFSLHGNQYFTNLDLVKGYYQIPLHQDSVECTAFSTTRNLYQFKRLSFGLKNAPSAFQREMQSVLREFDTKNVVVFIDDVLIASRTFEEHLTLVSRVMNTLSRYGIKIKLSKCCWFREEVTFLGHIVGRTGVKKCPTYTAAVVNFPKPKNVKELRSFIGMVNFQRKYIAHCSTISKPLTSWLGASDKTLLNWTEDMEVAFGRLKEEMAKDIELAYPDYSPDAPLMELSTDGSKHGGGACLTQEQSGSPRVIAYGSTTFNRAQSKYGALELELAAIRWALSNMKSFLYGVPFVLYTDHNPLVWMTNMAKQNARIMRTWCELAEYDFSIRYRPGRENTLADALSRLHKPEESEQQMSGRVMPEGLYGLNKVDGGGDSMILSLMTTLQHHRGQVDTTIEVPPTPQKLRSALANELLQQSECYGLQGDKMKKSLVKLSKLEGQPPPVEFFSAFSKIYGLQVWVHLGLAQPLIFSVGDNVPCSDPAKRVHLECISGIHYNPVAENKLFSPKQLCNDLVSTEDHLVWDEETDEEDVVPSSEIAWVNQVPICGHKPNAIRSTIVIGGIACCAIIDTGAQVSLLDEEVWRRMDDNSRSKFVVEELNAPLRSLGSNAVRSNRNIRGPWDLSGAPVECSSPFGLVPPGTLCSCVLIGANLIRELQLRISYASQTFTFVSGGLVQRRRLSLPEVHLATLEDVCYQLQDDKREFFSYINVGYDHLKEAQRGDRTIRKVVSCLRVDLPAAEWDRSVRDFRRYRSNLVEQDGYLWYVVKGVYMLVVPYKVMVDMVVKTHARLSHLGRGKLADLLKSLIWHPTLSSVIADVCRTCMQCQLFKTHAQIIAPPVLKLAMNRPFELMSLDLLMLPPTSRGNKYCLVCVDHYSKWAAVVPLKDKKAITVAEAFGHQVLPFLPRRPERVLTDNGAEFTAECFRKVLQSHGINLCHSTPYMPSCNGGVERLNRTIVGALRCTSDPSPWDQRMADVVITYNNTYHASIQMSPAECLMSQAHDVKIDALRPVTQQENWREGHPKFTSFRSGERVLRKTILHGNLLTNKFSDRYSGPYTVVKVRDNGRSYSIKETSTGKEIPAHHAQLTKYHAPPKYLQEYNDVLGHREDHTNMEQPDVDETLDYQTGDESDEGEPTVSIHNFSSLKSSRGNGMGGKSTTGEPTGAAPVLGSITPGGNSGMPERRYPTRAPVLGRQRGVKQDIPRVSLSAGGSAEGPFETLQYFSHSTGDQIVASEHQRSGKSSLGLDLMTPRSGAISASVPGGQPRATFSPILRENRELTFEVIPGDTGKGSYSHNFVLDEQTSQGVQRENLFHRLNETWIMDEADSLPVGLEDTKLGSNSIDSDSVWNLSLEKSFGLLAALDEVDAYTKGLKTLICASLRDVGLVSGTQSSFNYERSPASKRDVESGRDRSSARDSNSGSSVESLCTLVPTPMLHMGRELFPGQMQSSVVEPPVISLGSPVTVKPRPFPKNLYKLYHSTPNLSQEDLPAPLRDGVAGGYRLRSRGPVPDGDTVMRRPLEYCHARALGQTPRTARDR